MHSVQGVNQAAGEKHIKINRQKKIARHPLQVLLLTTFFVAGAFSSSCLESSETVDISKKEAKQQSNTYFTFKDWQSFHENHPKTEDLLILKDGTILAGEIESLPPIRFSFGDVRFHLEEIALVSFIEQGKQNKVQYITNVGENFVGLLASTAIPFREKKANGLDNQIIKIEPSRIDHIFLFKRNADHTVANKRLFSLELKNGDQLPVAPILENIRLTEGWEEFQLPVQDIVQVSYNGGLQGIVKDDVKGTKELNFSLVKDKYFCFHLASKGYTLKLPWDKIASIQGCNCGFNQPLADLQERSTSTLTMGSPPELIAFAPEAFEAFMQPIPPREKPTEKAGTSALHSTQQAPIKASNSVGQAPPKVQQIFVAADFDSPFFHIAYELEHLEFDENQQTNANRFLAFSDNSDDAEIVFVEEPPPIFNKADPETLTVAFEDDQDLNAIFSDVPENLALYDIDFSQPGDDEIALSDVDLVKINEKIMFENAPQVSVDPKPFDVIEEPMAEPKLSIAASQKKNIFVPPISKVIEKDFDFINQLARADKQIKATFVPTFPVPSLWIELNGFYIDKSPVTNEEYKLFIEASGKKPPSHWVNGIIPRNMENKPVVNVNFTDATAYALWAGKQLPSEMEWEYASLESAFLSSNALKEWVDNSFIADMPLLETKIPFNQNSSDKYRLIVSRDRNELNLLHGDDSNSYTTFRCVQYR